MKCLPTHLVVGHPERLSVSLGHLVLPALDAGLGRDCEAVQEAHGGEEGGGRVEAVLLVI